MVHVGFSGCSLRQPVVASSELVGIKKSVHSEFFKLKYVLGVVVETAHFQKSRNSNWKGGRVFQETLNFNNPNPEAKAHPSTLPIGHHP